MRAALSLTLLEAWSKRYTGGLNFALPEGWQLATHQKEVYDTLHEPDIDVVFDTAMTGDGKSLAAYLPMLRPQAKRLGNAVVAYPTNELIRDQERQVKNYLDDFSVDLSFQKLNGETIGSVAKENEVSRYESIKDLVYRQKLLLTNPDVFNLIESFAYTSPINPATLAQEFSSLFRYVVFDEFHIFAAPQIAAIIDAMLFIRANGSANFPTKFLFLSATPSPILRDVLDNADFRFRVIEGSYQHGPKPKGAYRSILQEATLELEPCEANTGGILGWATNNLEKIKGFYRENPGSKGLIICNSVFTAKKLYAYLREGLVDTGISLGENTGLTGKEEKQRSLEQDLVVATSTVDVGVDFRINFLIFESLNAGSFIQRLGRLGRHKDFPVYHAVALLPQFLVERFAKHYQDGQTVDRWSFFQNLSEIKDDKAEQIFPPEQEFKPYIKRWGGVKAVQRLGKLYKYGGKDKYQTLIQRYQPNAAQVFKIASTTQARARRLEPAVNKELFSFRGAGLMDIWTFDPSSKAVTTVNVLRLLAGTEFGLISKQEAEAIAIIHSTPFYPTYLNLYAKIHSYKEEYDFVQLRYQHTFGDDGQAFNHAADRAGFLLEAAHPDIRKVSQALVNKPLCSCVCDKELSGESPRNAQRILSLPPLFSLAQVIDSTNTSYTVAFGHEALLLDSLIHWRKINDYFIA